DGQHTYLPTQPPIVFMRVQTSVLTSVLQLLVMDNIPTYPPSLPLSSCSLTHGALGPFEDRSMAIGGVNNNLTTETNMTYWRRVGQNKHAMLTEMLVLLAGKTQTGRGRKFWVGG
ncbi:hypothetical protein BaRGS_00035653, partial [Batillaria attramentaria]